ncbi:MAG TPA: hypothetical protein VF532_20415, partial [Candidatus Angelobacter sp.]
MKTTLIRLFALAMLATSIPGFAVSTPSKDEKMNTPCTPASTGSQDANGQSKDNNMMQSKDDNMMQSKDDTMMKDTKHMKKKGKKDKKQNQ